MPAEVVLVLHAHLARYASGREEVSLPWREGADIASYVEVLGIPGHEFYAVVRGGLTSRDLTAVPRPGERIELLPAMSGG